MLDVSRFSSSRKTALLTAAVLAGILCGSQPALGAQGDCCQPISTGPMPVASDCLLILRVAVGTQACTPEPCVCDPTGDGSTTATDALTCLKLVVGTPVTIMCPCSTTTTTMPVANCTNDGVCNANDDCVCVDCDDDLFCSDPANCTDNGNCNTFVEGCVCADCMNLPVCARK